MPAGLARRFEAAVDEQAQHLGCAPAIARRLVEVAILQRGIDSLEQEARSR